MRYAVKKRGNFAFLPTDSPILINEDVMNSTQAHETIPGDEKSLQSPFTKDQSIDKLDTLQMSKMRLNNRSTNDADAFLHNKSNFELPQVANATIDITSGGYDHMQKRRSDAETRRMQNLTISEVPAITKNMTARDKLDALSPLSPKASVSTTLDEKNVRVSGYLFSQDSI